MLHNETLWSVYQDKVPQELLEDPDFRLELIHLGLFRDVKPIIDFPGGFGEQCGTYRIIQRHCGRCPGTGLKGQYSSYKTGPIVREQIRNYWVQSDIQSFGENRVPPDYVDKLMVHRYCENHRIMPLEPKILGHLSL